MNRERKAVVVLIEIFCIISLVYSDGGGVPGLGREKYRMIVDAVWKETIS